MPKKGQGAAMLRDLRDEERPAHDEEEPSRVREAPLAAAGQALERADEQASNTDGRKPVLTEARTSVSTDAMTEGSAEARAPAREDVSAPVITGVSKHSRKSALKSAPTDVPFLERVDEALASREPLTGGVKATVDMSPELSSRAKRYLADHRGQNTRQVLVALLDAFLADKGY